MDHCPHHAAESVRHRRPVANLPALAAGEVTPASAGGLKRKAPARNEAGSLREACSAESEAGVTVMIPSGAKLGMPLHELGETPLSFLDGDPWDVRPAEPQIRG